ncbi:MAG: EscU/YscU/HrcU family type III secretion system export apparatus switch protein, partial [Burkholderiaceae bacterium]|nr:EscU/YscU/HrcU family type III secretion system export apparatus switch protein [Burkholderiaceae bacterium]
MAEAEHSSQERTLEPSARRLEQARREGQIPRSRYLAHLLVLGAAALALLLLAPAAIAGLRALLARALTFDAAALQAPLPLRLAEVAAQAAWTAAPILLLLAVAALAAPLAVGGWL